MLQLLSIFPAVNIWILKLSADTASAIYSLHENLYILSFCVSLGKWTSSCVAIIAKLILPISVFKGHNLVDIIDIIVRTITATKDSFSLTHGLVTCHGVFYVQPFSRQLHYFYIFKLFYLLFISHFYIVFSFDISAFLYNDLFSIVCIYL